MYRFPWLGYLDFWWIADNVLNKSKSAIPHFLSFASDKANILLKVFLRNFILTPVSLYLLFFYRTNQKPDNISITPKLLNKVITNLDLLKTSGPDYIPVVVFKNCEPKLSYILTEPFNMCLKESCFPDWRKVSSEVPVFKNVGEGLQTTTLLVLFLWWVKSLKNL